MLNSLKWFSATFALNAIIAVTNAIGQPPEDYEGKKKWLEALTDEERREYFEGQSEEFIQENGEEANRLRLCIDLE